MDIKEKIQDIVEDVVEKLKKDPSLLADFKTKPVKVLEKLIGKDLPDEQVEKVITLIKAKLMKDKIEDKADDIKDELEEKADDIKSALKGLDNLFSK